MNRHAEASAKSGLFYQSLPAKVFVPTLVRQLLLENESQGAFDHLSAEVGTLKSAIGTLSKVVDGEHVQPVIEPVPSRASCRRAEKHEKNRRGCGC